MLQVKYMLLKKKILAKTAFKIQKVNFSTEDLTGLFGEIYNQKLIK